MVLLVNQKKLIDALSPEELEEAFKEGPEGRFQGLAFTYLISVHKSYLERTKTSIDHENVLALCKGADAS